MTKHLRMYTLKYSVYIVSALLVTTLAGGCGEAPYDHGRHDIGALYLTLDSLIACQSELIAEKEARIEAICAPAASIHLTAEQAYDLNNQLYDEYVAFNFDSAHHVISKNLEATRGSSDARRRAESLIRMAHILAVAGLFDKACNMLDSVNVSRLSDEGRVDYYNQRAELYLYQSEMAQHSTYFTEYIDSAQYYRRLIVETAAPGSFAYTTNQAGFACEDGRLEEAISILLDELSGNQASGKGKMQPGERNYSVVASTLAYFFWRKGETDAQEYYLLRSAVSDMRGAILENTSLRELATILMERGDYKRAYKYLSQASQDARLYGSRLRGVQVARMTPLITQAYDAERTHMQQRSDMLLAVVSVVAVLLVLTILYTLSLMRKRRVASEKIRLMNTELTTSNTNMQIMNAQLREVNHIKDEYIGRFLELCSTLIHRGEERQRVLNRLARERKLDELYESLKDSGPISEGIRLFHQNFDTAFLNIFPTFIAEVNSLLAPDKRFDVPENSGRLTTELRILALVRLGICDNQRIAEILRTSINTVYTYRSTIKSRALQRDRFEEDVKGLNR